MTASHLSVKFPNPHEASTNASVEGSMRRVLGTTITGLGAFFLVLALLLRFVLPGQVIKFRLNEYVKTTLAGQDASYFSQGQGKVITGVSAQITSTTWGDVAAGTSSTAVWNEFTAVEDATNNAAIQYISQRSAFDRRSGLIVDCCGAYVNITSVGTTSGHQSGLAYAWPIGTQPITYEVFDTILGRPESYRYAGTGTIDGMTADKFVEQVSNQQFATQSLADSSGATRLLLFKGVVSSTPATVKNAVNTASSSHLKIELIEDIGPLVTLLLGVILLVLGITLSVTRRDDEEFVYETDEPVGSTF